MPKTRMSRRVVRQKQTKNAITSGNENAKLGDDAAQQVLGISDKAIIEQEHPVILKEKDKEVKKTHKKSSHYRDARNQKLQKASKKTMKDTAKVTNFKMVQ